MPETKPDLNYVCPHCGQPAVAGNHFCEKTSAPASPAPKAAPKSTKGRTGGVVMLVVVGVAVIALWRFLGPASLVIAALGLLGLLYWKAGKKK
jgi:hypothetical protein